MSDQDICGTCGLFVRGPDVQGDACPGHDSHETAPNGVPYRDMWAGGVGPQPQLHADQSIGNPGTMPREAYQHSDTPRTDAVSVECSGHKYRECVDTDFARQLERENAELSDQVMRWFQAASPYATPGSLERGLKKLRAEVIEECALICESRAGEGQYAESQAAWRILLSAATAIRAFKNFRPDGPIDSTVKPSAWD